jgi:acetyl esterase/lipase
MPDEATTIPTGEVTVEDVAYQNVNGRPMLARLYRPARPLAALVEVHGGAWTSNDRLRNEPMVTPLAADGTLVMSIDFRMPPEAGYPASIADVNLAIRWLKSHAADYGINPGKVGLLGTSSGGHQVLLAAVKPDDARYAALPLPGGTADARVAYAIACWPIADPLDRYRMAEREGKARLVANHDAYWGGEAAMQDGSPQRIVEAGEQTALPPILIVHGTEDGNVKHTASERYAATYRKAGGTAEVHIYEGQPHAFIGEDVSHPDSVDAIGRIAAFIRRQGR